MTRLRSERGFTLIEALVAMALSGVVFAATLTAMETFQRTSRGDNNRKEAQDSARNAIDNMARQLRSVAAPSTGSFGALELAEPYSVTFQTVDAVAPPPKSENVNNSMRVRYCLDDSSPSNEIVWMQVKRWQTPTPSPATAPTTTACPDRVSSDWESSTRLALHLTNRNGGQSRPLFIYGPGGATEVSAITVVEPHLYVDVNPGHLPGETLQNSAVYLRNANRQPIAAFTATEVAGHVKLNASESIDPDGLALTYKWMEGATVLPSTSQLYETPKYEVHGSVHTFTLIVADPGNLTNTTSHAVTIK